MKIRNKTGYNTEDLRKFFSAGLKAAGASNKKTITVDYSRGGSSYISGRASIGQEAFVPMGEGIKHRKLYEGFWIKMHLPNPHSKLALALKARGTPRELDLKVLAHVFRHEVMHNLGIRHGEMSPVERNCAWETLPKWAEGLVIRFNEPSVEPTVKVSPAERAKALVEKREAKAWVMLHKAEHKLELAERAVKKWSVKVNYYDRARKLREAGCIEQEAAGNTKWVIG